MLGGLVHAFLFLVADWLIWMVKLFIDLFIHVCLLSQFFVAGKVLVAIGFLFLQFCSPSISLLKESVKPANADLFHGVFVKQICEISDYCVLSQNLILLIPPILVPDIVYTMTIAPQTTAPEKIAPGKSPPGQLPP